MIRIGMVGAGRMSTLHAGLLAEIPEARICAVSDVLFERAQQLAATCGAAPYRSYEEMLARESLDAIYICTPTGEHADQAVFAAQRGLPFFIEKPLALTMVDAWRIFDAVERAGVMTCVDYQWRYTGAVQRAQEILAGRKLALVAAEWLWTLPPILWFRDREQGGGQVVDQTTHLTDLCQLFAGPVTEVYAAYSHNTYSDAEFRNWEGYSLSFKHASGAVGSLHSTYALFKEIAEFESPRLDLAARELFLRITPEGLTVITPGNKQEYPNEGPLHRNINRAFVSAMVQRDPGFCPSSVGVTLRSLALTLAANESAVSGQPVELDEFLARTRVPALGAAAPNV